MKICQNCMRKIYVGDDAVQINYGKMRCTAHPQYKVSSTDCDFFHRGCDIAIREKKND